MIKIDKHIKLCRLGYLIACYCLSVICIITEVLNVREKISKIYLVLVHIIGNIFNEYHS